MEGPTTRENKDLCMAIAARSFSFRGRGGQETWAGGRVMSIMRVIKAIGNNEERKRNHSTETQDLTWKTLSNKER
jgi:hypothetical protein